MLEMLQYVVIDVKRGLEEKCVDPVHKHIVVIDVKSENHAKEIVGMMTKDECESI